MKKKNILLAGLALLGLVSCNDYLDVDAPSKYTEEFIFSDVEEANKLLNGVYRSLTHGDSYGNRLLNEFLLNSDVEWATNTNETQSASHNEYKAFDAEADASSLLTLWNRMYTTIEVANDFITGAERSPILSDLSEANAENRAQMLQMLGEAKCIRAINYLDLTLLIGDVPFSFTRSYDNSSNLVMPIADRDEIQTKLINDLIAIAPQMKLTSELNSIEHCSKELAWSLIARIALFRGGYSLRHTDDPSFVGEMKRPADWEDYYRIAKTYTDSVIIAGTHSLGKNWYDVFLDECKYITSTVDDDPIFELPFTIDVSGNVGYVHGPAYSLTTTVGETWGSSNGGLRLSALHRFTYDESDVRRQAIGYWSYSNGTPSLLNNQTNYCNKWSKLFDPDHRMSVDGTGSTGINFPYMRYADVLLMYAEAVNQIDGPTGAGNSGLTAQQALEQVRERAFRNSPDADKQELVYDYVEAATSKEDFLKLIQDERAWEFAGEGLRWKDLVRWDIYNDVIFKTFWQFYSIGEQDDSVDPKYNHVYPSRVFYKVVSRGDEGWDYNFPNQTLQQLRFYKDDASGFDNIWMYFSTEYRDLMDNIPTTGTNAWQSAYLFNWQDDNLGIPTAACRLSVRGYIYADQGDQLHPNINYPAAHSSLPTLRYILPIPQDAISRSNGTYKNYYGY